jgi:hypothetical protein
MSYGFLYGVGKYLRHVGIMCTVISLVGFIACILLARYDYSGSIGAIFKISFSFAALGVVSFVTGIMIGISATSRIKGHKSENNHY